MRRPTNSVPGMTLEEFASRFRSVAAGETRVVTVQSDGFLPKGEFGFLEFYCPDPKCDCRRVNLRVTSPDGRAWATISYGWESKRFYSRWARANRNGADMAGASLDPLNTQSPFADAFLSFFNDMIVTDQKYVERLKRHYRMFKEPANGTITKDP